MESLKLIYAIRWLFGDVQNALLEPNTSSTISDLDKFHEYQTNEPFTKIKNTTMSNETGTTTFLHSLRKESRAVNEWVYLRT